MSMFMFLGLIFVFLKSLFRYLNMICLVFFWVVFMLGYGGSVCIVFGRQVFGFSFDFLRIFFWKLMFFLLKNFEICVCFMKSWIGICSFLLGRWYVKLMRKIGWGCDMKYMVVMNIKSVEYVIMFIKLNCKFIQSCYKLLGFICLVFSMIFSNRGMKSSVSRWVIR